MEDQRQSASFRGLPYLPRQPSLSLSFTEVSDRNNAIYRQVVSQAAQRGFDPPSTSEVIKYMSKSLPATPDHAETAEQTKETHIDETPVTESMVYSVKAHTPYVSQTPETLPTSCSASIRTSFTQQSTAPTATDREEPPPGAWFTRMRKRNEGNLKWHVDFRRSRSSTWS